MTPHSIANHYLFVNNRLVCIITTFSFFSMCYFVKWGIGCKGAVRNSSRERCVYTDNEWVYAWKTQCWQAVQRQWENGRGISATHHVSEEQSLVVLCRGCLWHKMSAHFNIQSKTYTIQGNTKTTEKNILKKIWLSFQHPPSDYLTGIVVLFVHDSWQDIDFIDLPTGRSGWV